MQATFDAWNVTRYGGPAVLSPVTRDLPALGQKDILIRVRASAVTRADGMMRAGKPRFARLFLGLSRPRSGLSGTCFSGEVVAAGPDVTTFRVGDAVFGEAGLTFGANATHIRLPEDGSLMHKPNFLSHAEAATLCDGALTSWHFLTRVGGVKAGDKVLVLGGAGSLGTAAVQFAKALGTEVSATSSARNLDLLRSLGADHAIDYREEEPLTSGADYHVIFDTLGVASFTKAKPALAPSGRYVCPVLGLRLLRDMIMSRITGSKRASFAAAGMEKPAVHRAHLAEILTLIEEGGYTPVMDRTYPLADLVEAHSYVETGHKRGNVVVV